MFVCFVHSFLFLHSTLLIVIPFSLICFLSLLLYLVLLHLYVLLYLVLSFLSFCLFPSALPTIPSSYSFLHLFNFLQFAFLFFPFLYSLPSFVLFLLYLLFRLQYSTQLPTPWVPWEISLVLRRSGPQASQFLHLPPKLRTCSVIPPCIHTPPYVIFLFILLCPSLTSVCTFIFRSHFLSSIDLPSFCPLFFSDFPCVPNFLPLRFLPPDTPLRQTNPHFVTKHPVTSSVPRCHFSDPPIRMDIRTQYPYASQSAVCRLITVRRPYRPAAPRIR